MSIAKANVTEQTATYLKQQIHDGVWKIGEKIPSENQLTLALGVSRASVRMAIQQLVGTGCLESFHGKGTFVINDDFTAIGALSHTITIQDCQDLNQVLEYRLIIEPGCAFHAAQRATIQNISNLRHYLDEMKESIGNQESFVRYDIEFHKEISQAAHNPLLAKSLFEVFNQTTQQHKRLNQLFGYSDGVRYHSQMLAAITQGDSAKAEELMRAHLTVPIERLAIH